MLLFARGEGRMAAPKAAAGSISATKKEPKSTKSLATSSNVKRIQKELAEINLDPPCNCTAGPKEDNIFEWVSTIQGPASSPYEGGLFYLDIFFPQEYPFKPQRLSSRQRFITVI